jgi:Zn finger protein HypA/HybF involved in hydrogenase expression
VGISQGLTDLGGALGALQTASNIVKTFAGLRSDNERSAKLVELTNQIVAAQTGAIQANAAQAKLINRVDELEKELMRFETWTAEKQRYELKEIAIGSFAYAVKKETQGSEPMHFICQTCYENGKKRILQIHHRPHVHAPLSKRSNYICPECKAEIDK